MSNPFPEYCESCGRAYFRESVTPQNKRVLDLLITGMRNKEIGEAMTPPIDERTVKAHVARLMRIFAVKNRVQLAFTCSQPLARIAVGLPEYTAEENELIKSGAD